MTQMLPVLVLAFHGGLVDQVVHHDGVDNDCDDEIDTDGGDGDGATAAAGAAVAAAEDPGERA